MKKILVILAIGMGFTSISFTVINNQDKKPWPAPDKYLKMANPQKTATAESLKEGKELWAKQCQSCHGKSGKGDGSKAPQLKTEAGNFTLPATQKQSDGSLFYKITEGRGDMPSFKKKIPDAEDIWSLVNYMRTFKS
ncbi:MAG TPA: cytochrome c [Ferruginibacter sp.]|nr:cytochrome c [Ferruginibacter sp.]